MTGAARLPDGSIASPALLAHKQLQMQALLQQQQRTLQQQTTAGAWPPAPAGGGAMPPPGGGGAHAPPPPRPAAPQPTAQQLHQGNLVQKQNQAAAAAVQHHQRLLVHAQQQQAKAPEQRNDMLLDVDLAAEGRIAVDSIKAPLVGGVGGGATAPRPVARHVSLCLLVCLNCVQLHISHDCFGGVFDRVRTLPRSEFVLLGSFKDLRLIRNQKV